jgi:hypothetical protein
MKITRFLLLIFFMTTGATYGAAGSEPPKYYYGHSHSIVNWPNIKTKDYLDLSLWQEEQLDRDNNKEWKKGQRDSQIYERAGLVLSCVGTCHLFRGREYSKVNYLSSFREGDELQTLPGSYMWVVMLDGTLVRFSPETSMTMNEINISRKVNFLYARINYGNVLWWSRTEHEFDKHKVRETDRLFLPLEFVLANKKDGDSREEVKARLNELIRTNNKLMNKPTYSFVVMPNGSLAGKDVIAEFIVLPHSNSYLKLRDESQLKLIAKLTDVLPTFYYRGHENTEEKKLERNIWYSVSKNGDKLDVDENKNFGLGEFLTKNITTILTARELILKTRTFAFENYSQKFLGEKYGYRLWTGFEKGGELAKRLAFIKDYSRRVETTSLKVAERYKKRSKVIRDGKYDSKYFSRAMSAYSTFSAKEPRVFHEKKLLLNSEKKKFWKYIHGKR